LHIQDTWAELLALSSATRPTATPASGPTAPTPAACSRSAPSTKRSPPPRRSVTIACRRWPL